MCAKNIIDIGSVMVFHASMLIRCANDGKMHLHEKRNGQLSQLKAYQTKNPFLILI